MDNEMNGEESECAWDSRVGGFPAETDTDVENKHVNPEGKEGMGWIGRLRLTYIHY